MTLESSWKIAELERALIADAPKPRRLGEIGFQLETRKSGFRGWSAASPPLRRFWYPGNPGHAPAHHIGRNPKSSVNNCESAGRPEGVSSTSLGTLAGQTNHTSPAGSGRIFVMVAPARREPFAWLPVGSRPGRSWSFQTPTPLHPLA